MERQQVIDVRVPIGTGGAGSGTLLLEERPVAVAAAAPPVVPPNAIRMWLWRAATVIAVLLVVAGLLAWGSAPPV